MRDQTGREIDYMRISITDRCNLRCKYCMPDGIQCMPRWEILSLEENNRFLGLAIMAKAGDRVLLDYFAIADEVRGHGAGSAALQALRERYQGMRIIIEIESTKCEDEEELALRTRRKKFYLRNGFTMLPYYIDLWGTEMEMLSNGQPCPYEEYLDIYTTAFGTKVSDKIHFLGDAPAADEI